MRLLGNIALRFGLAVAGFNAAVYTYRAVLLRRMPECDAPEPVGLIHATWAFVKEYACLVAVLALTPIGWLLPRRRNGAGTRGPVILVHGWGLNRGSLWLLQRRLVRDGWSPVCCFEYRSWSADIERAAEQLHALIEQFEPRRPLSLVGHSLGGLVLRYCVRRYPAPNVRRLVTLGTPHNGTELGRLPGPAGRRLAPGSSFLNTLNAADRVPQQFDVIAIHSTFDAMILPPANARYPGAFNIEVNNVGHNALLFSKKVYQLIAENLAAPLGRC